MSVAPSHGISTLRRDPRGSPVPSATGQPSVNQAVGSHQNPSRWHRDLIPSLWDRETSVSVA